MKIIGIILVVVGALATLGNIVQLSQGQGATGAGIGFIILGAFLISRGNKNKEKEKEKENWAKDTTEK